MSLKLIEQIESPSIKEIAKYLFDKGTAITFFGKAWGGCTNNWIYFDTYLDIEKLRTEFNLSPHLELHENLDPKSGMERGFIDTTTGEAIMGKVKQ